MRRISIRTLRNKLSTQLQNLPAEITKNGKIIAILCTQEDYYDEVEIEPQKPSNRNHSIKTTSPTGGIPMAEIDAITRSYFNPQPKTGKT